MNEINSSSSNLLCTVKLLHTLVWTFFAGCIIAVPIFAWLGSYGHAAFLAGIVLVEVFVLIFNGWSCPLTGVAARYTDDPRDNFDIYLPQWLARHNKTIFSVLYLLGMLVALSLWAGWMR